MTDNSNLILSEAENKRFQVLADRLRTELVYGNNPVYARVSKPETKEFSQLAWRLYWATQKVDLS